MRMSRIMWCLLVAMFLIGAFIGSSMVIAHPGSSHSHSVVQDNDAAASEDLAVLALRDGCDDTQAALTWSGSGGTIDGSMHSNDGLRLTGSNNTVTGSVTSACPADVTGASNDLGAGPSQAEVVSSPVNVQTSDFACDFEPPRGNLDQDGPWWEGGTSTSGRLIDGVYCAEGRIRLGASGVSGTVTFVANGPDAEVHLSGSNFDLRPFAGNLLAYAEGARGDSIRISGSGGSWQGVLYAPNGEVALTGSGVVSPGGMIIGDIVSLSGSGLEITSLPLQPPGNVTDSTGAIVVHVYTCPAGIDDDRADEASCAPAGGGLAFEISPAGGDDERVESSNTSGLVTFDRLPPGDYQLDALDFAWCRAESDSVNSQGEVEVQAGEESNVWIFTCAAGV